MGLKEQINFALLTFSDIEHNPRLQNMFLKCSLYQRFDSKVNHKDIGNHNVKN